ncbi:hypothetical protein D4764_15G0009180 [Takifugu flavidus]|uniref:Ig-like domain-containing protein n=1 Tax=Takifugu flavidus TaxID=433684 RepID=A0A5C6P160_9TELE|nr:hypothetical protein D4764_15G0009180 [Takifugu flavidus]
MAGWVEREEKGEDRNGGALPDGTSVVGEKLIFGRPLRLNDSGLYECVVKNKLGFGKTEYMMTISENSQLTDDSPISKQFLTIIGASAGALVIFLVTVVFLVNCYHRKKNRKLVRQLSGKMEEINNLSRETSLRRLNSFSTDPRVQPDDYALLRVDSCLKNSQLSLEYFQELLNPTNTYPQGGTESGDQEVDHPISGAEVAEGCPGCHASATLRGHRVPLDWQTGVVVPIFKSGDQRVCSNYRGITLLRVEGVEFGRRKISLLLFSEDVVLLAPSRTIKDLQHMLGSFPTECEAAGMWISTSKSESMLRKR